MNPFLRKWFGFLGQQSPALCTGFGLMFVVCIGFLDYLTGPQLSLAIFYLLPISLLTWYGDRRIGLCVSLFAAMVWLAADLITKPSDIDWGVPYWNAGVRLSMFVVVVLLLASVRQFNHMLETMVDHRTALLREQTVQHTRAAQAARESEQLFRQIAENIKEVFWVTDPTKSQMIYISPGYEIIWGRTCQSLYDSPLTWLNAIHPADRERVANAASTKQADGRYNEIYRIVRPDGGVRWIQDRAFPVRDESGTVCRIIGIAEDISARKRVERRDAAFASLSHRLSAASTPVEASHTILEIADELFGWDSAYIDLYSAAEDRILSVLTIDTVDGRRSEIPPDSFSLNPTSLMRLVMREGARLINRAEDTPVPVELIPFGDTGRYSCSLMFVPIHSRGTVVGILSNQSYTPDTYTPEDLTLLQALADHCGDTLQRINVAETLRESENQFRTLFESAPIGMVLCRAEGNIVRANRAYRDMLGYTAEEPSGLELLSLMHRDDRAEGESHHRQLMSGQFSQYSREQRLLHKDGYAVWAKSRVCAVRDPQNKLRFIIAMVEDVTERHVADERIRQLASIVDSAHDAIIGTNLDGTIVNWNRAAEQLYGYAADEILGAPISILSGSEQAEEPIHVLEHIVNEGGIETAHQRKTGERIHVSLSISPLFNNAGEGCGASVIARDMTERRRLEQEVLEISAAERRTVGHELHDGVGQHLAGTAFKAKLLEELLMGESPPLAQQARAVVALINAGIDQVRRLAHGLDPVEVEAAGLAPALGQLANDTQSVFGVPCAYHCGQQIPHFSSPVSLQLFRIAQEAIHNAIEHGKAKGLRIELTASDSRICLEIADDGVGFAEAAQSPPGMGLRIMKYRARAIGGFLQIDSELNRGTRITCIVPTFRKSDIDSDPHSTLAQRPLIPPLQEDDS